MWSFALGANLNRHWGGEFDIDFYERDFNYKGMRLGEVGALHLVPHVRLRKPFLNNRLVPYVIAGAGVSFLQFNDAKTPAFGHQIGIDDATFTATAGGGLEYFISDNVTVGFEGRYFWLQPVSGTVDGERVDVDLSAPTFTLGLRVFLDENHARPLVDAESESPNRFYFGVRIGGAIMSDSRWMPGVKLEPESSSFGDVNQTGGLLFGGWVACNGVRRQDRRAKMGGLALHRRRDRRRLLAAHRLRAPKLLEPSPDLCPAGRLAPAFELQAAASALARRVDHVDGVRRRYSRINDSRSQRGDAHVVGWGSAPVHAQGSPLSAALSRGIQRCVGRHYGPNGRIRLGHSRRQPGRPDTFTARCNDTDVFPREHRAGGNRHRGLERSLAPSRMVLGVLLECTQLFPLGCRSRRRRAHRDPRGVTCCCLRLWYRFTCRTARTKCRSAESTRSAGMQRSSRGRW